jgi:dethiobiotin synthetase
LTRVFVTATGTGVGKTLVMCRLIAELSLPGRRVRALKPVATGFDAGAPATSDTGRLLEAQGLPLSHANLETTTPWRYRAPLSPDMAARREQRSIPFDELVAFCAESADAELTLIEGIGGVMVPLDAEHTVLDWIERVAPKTILVAGSYLGTLSHTLTAAAALRGRGIELAGVVISESLQQPTTLAETADTLRRFLRAVPVIALSRNPERDTSRIADFLETFATR